MIIKLEIAEEKAETLSKGGKEELKKRGVAYLERTLDEANRREASANVSNGKLEVTGTMINEAADFVEKFRPRYKKKNKFAWKMIALITTLVSGNMFDLEDLKKGSGYLMVFLIVSFVCVGTHIHLFSSNDSENV